MKVKKTTIKNFIFLFLILTIEINAQTTIFNADFSGTTGHNAFSVTAGSTWAVGSNGIYPTSGSGDYLFLIPSGSTYPPNSNTAAITPTIDLRTYERLTLSFRFYANIEPTYDGLRILFSTDNGATYLPLGKENDQATNLYNNTNIQAYGASANIRGWSGNFTAGNWITASIDLPSQGFDNKTNIKFRIEFRSDNTANYTGVAIDDFKITGYSIAAKTYPSYSAFNKLEVWYKPQSL